MTTIDQLFTDLRAAGKKAFMPFITAGDPNLEFTRQLLLELQQRGCHMCELGIPYSDPIADGPVIQASYTRALDQKTKLNQILGMLEAAAPKLTMPVLTMVSYAIIYRRGLNEYVDAVKRAGVSGLIVPDLPVEESEKLAGICRAAEISLVQLITPTTSRPRQRRIAETSTGFIYYVSVVGITGERTKLPVELVDHVGWLREQTELPICIGFGISQPEHVRQLAPVADGLIVGSAIVRRVAECDHKPPQQVLDEIGAYAQSLLDALA
ncbi:MAG: tryptophan synthase subunit alpha [Pirellulales bacterium]